MVAAGVIAGDNRDAFLWNKKKKKEEDSDFYSTIQHEFNLQRKAPFIRLTPHTKLARMPHTTPASWRLRTRKWPRRRRATKAHPRPTSQATPNIFDSK
jgi:hypothetical protein